MSDRGWNEEIDTYGLVKLTQFCMSSIAVVTKRELSNTAKLSVFKSVFVQILTYGYEVWVMTERTLFQVQVQAELGFFQRVHCVTLYNAAMKFASAEC